METHVCSYDTCARIELSQHSNWGSTLVGQRAANRVRIQQDRRLAQLNNYWSTQVYATREHTLRTDAQTGIARNGVLTRFTGARVGTPISKSMERRNNLVPRFRYSLLRSALHFVYSAL